MTEGANYGREVIEDVLARLSCGNSTYAVAKATGVSRPTVSRWGRGELPAYAARPANPPCPGCCRADHARPTNGAAYAYLLGAYLGDGWLTKWARSTRLCLAMDMAYPGLIKEVVGAIGSVVPQGRPAHVYPYARQRCFKITKASRHWPCLFPQHGPGRKHQRCIADIRKIFTDTCDLLGIAWCPWGPWHISVARKDAVALLDKHVGLKT